MNVSGALASRHRLSLSQITNAAFLRPLLQEDSEKEHDSKMMIAVGGRYEQHDQMVDRMKLLLGRMSQNVSTVECLISYMSCHQDEIEIREKMKETTKQLEDLIPLMKTYLAMPEPQHPLSKQRWWMHRARINREMEVLLHNFQLLHIVLTAVGYTVSENGTVRSILQAEMRKLESVKTRFLIEDYDDTANIVAQAEKTFLMFFNSYGESRSNSYYVPELPQDGWYNNNNNELNNNEDPKMTDGPLQDGMVPKEEPRKSRPSVAGRNENKPRTPARRRKSTAPKKEERKHYCSIS